MTFRPLSLTVILVAAFGLGGCGSTDTGGGGVTGGQSCKLASDCGAGKQCVGGFCIAGCTSAADCGGLACLKGKCQAALTGGDVVGGFGDTSLPDAGSDPLDSTSSDDTVVTDCRVYGNAAAGINVQSAKRTPSIVAAGKPAIHITRGLDLLVMFSSTTLRTIGACGPLAPSS